MRYSALVLLVLAIVFPVLVGVGVLLSEPPPKPTGSDLVYRQGSYSVRLTNEPCGNEEYREQLESEGIPPARRSAIASGSRTYSGCYTRTMSGDVLTLDYLATETGTLPKEGFKQ